MGIKKTTGVISIVLGGLFLNHLEYHNNYGCHAYHTDQR